MLTMGSGSLPPNGGFSKSTYICEKEEEEEDKIDIKLQVVESLTGIFELLIHFEVYFYDIYFFIICALPQLSYGGGSKNNL